MTERHEELARRHCRACDGGVPPLSPEEAAAYLLDLPGWTLVDDGRKIRRTWTARSFRAGITFLDRVAELAEAQGHHPDVHLTDYRQVAIELTTHAIQGLSENDMILAARIDHLPIELRRGG